MFAGGRRDQDGPRPGTRDLVQITDQLQAVSRQAGPHLRTHADVYSALLAFTRGDWETVNAFAMETDRLMRSSPTTAFCVSAAIMLATGALTQARAGRVEEARALVRRMDAITYEKVVPAALRAMGLAFTGDRVEIDATPSNVTNRLPYLTLAAVATRRHEEALALAGQLEADAGGGARFYAALAQAVREEVERDRKGTVPAHALLRELGYSGWSDVLSARA